MGNRVYKGYIVPHFHYDVIYLRTFGEYLQPSMDNIIEALRIMEDNPEYTFLIEQVILLEHFWKYYPQYRERLKRFAKRGNIEVACGMYVMPDMCLISGESLIRQIEEGKNWIKEHLNLEVRTCWIADCWGHHRQLPQILRNCGYDYYAFSRAMPKELAKTSEFIWKGLDGTEMLTYWMLLGYDYFRFSYPEEIKENLQKGKDPVKVDFELLQSMVDKLRRYTRTNCLLIPDGRDFAKPQDIAPQMLKRWNRGNNAVKLRFSKSYEFFEAISKTKLPVYAVDLNPAFQGTYASRIEIKQWNRKIENKLYSLESLSALTYLFTGKCFDLRTIRKAIREGLLFNQFHDIISGTFTDESYGNILNRYKRTDQELDKAISKEIKALSKKIKITKVPGRYNLLVFNPHSFGSLDIAKITLDINKSDAKKIKVMEIKTGREIPSQPVTKEDASGSSEGKSSRATIIFPAIVPALGYTAYQVFLLKKRKSYDTSVCIIDSNNFENRFFRIKLGYNGLIKSLILKKTGDEFVDPERPYFGDLVSQIDKGDLWSYYQPIDCWARTTTLYSDPMPDKNTPWNRTYHSWLRDSINKIDVISKGPVRATIRIKSQIERHGNRSEVIQYMHLYDHLSRIDFQTEFIPLGRYYRLRLCFPTNIKGGRIRREIPFGYQECREGEYPCQNWIEYADRHKGICMVNRGLPGNNVTDGVMMLSLFRSIDMGFDGKSVLGFEEGTKHIFEYSIIPFMVGDRSYLPYRLGMEFNAPFICQPIGGQGKLPPQVNLVNIEPDNIVMSSIKKTGETILIRLYEAQGKKCVGRLIFASAIEDAQEADLLGKPYRALTVIKRNIMQIKFSPFQIKTLLLKFSKFII